MQQIFLYSHGFATHASDNGLFDEIATFFPDAQHVMFEYDDWNNNEAVAATFSERAKKLQDKYSQIRSENPNAEINLICHSQGCTIATLANLDGIEKTILLAPSMIYDTPDEEYKRQKNKNSIVLDDGTIIRSRSAGYKTIMKPEFFNDFSSLKDVQSLCNKLCKKTELFIIDALNDTVARKDYLKLDKNIAIKHINTEHDLKDVDGSRKELEKILHEIINS